MATTLRPSHSYAGHRTTQRRALAAIGARLIREGLDGLAHAIDVALTALHLAGALVLAASLVATAAGLVFFPPDRNDHQRPGMGIPSWPGELPDPMALDRSAPARGLHAGQ